MSAITAGPAHRQRCQVAHGSVLCADSFRRTRVLSEEPDRTHKLAAACQCPKVTVRQLRDRLRNPRRRSRQHRTHRRRRRLVLRLEPPAMLVRQHGGAHDHPLRAAWTMYQLHDIQEARFLSGQQQRSCEERLRTLQGELRQRRQALPIPGTWGLVAGTRCCFMTSPGAARTRWSSPAPAVSRQPARPYNIAAPRNRRRDRDLMTTQTSRTPARNVLASLS